MPARLYVVLPNVARTRSARSHDPYRPATLMGGDGLEPPTPCL
jgi:hypothetical protein